MVNYTYSVSVDQKKAIKKLNALEKEIKEVSKVSVKTVSQYGKAYAQAIAPYRTGGTFRAISTKGTNQYQAKIIAKDGHVNDNPPKRWKGKTFNLTYWMHFSPKARSKIHSGEPQFMFKTYTVVEKKFKVEVRKQFYQMAAKINKQ